MGRSMFSGTRSEVSSESKFPLPTPGDVLLQDYVLPHGLNLTQLAREIRVPPSRLHDICRSGRAITVDTALRLSRFFGKSDEYWINMQRSYELRTLRSEIQNELDQITPFTWPEFAEKKTEES